MSFYGVKLHRSDVLHLPEHPGTCSEETFAEWCRQRVESGERLAVDLFSGAGGLSLGIEHAGWTVAAAVDFDQRALETHRANFAGLSLRIDLGDQDERTHLINFLSQVEVDLIAGGPPCQPFSRAGRSKIRSLVRDGSRNAVDLRKELWRSYLEIVLQVRPRAVLMENVPDMALGDDFRVVRYLVDQLEQAEYHTNVNLVDAWKFGVPQHRKRLIVLARLDSDEFVWPAPSDPVYLRDAISDLPALPEDNPMGGRHMPYQPQEETSDFAKEMRKEVSEPGSVHDHMTRAVRDDDLEAFKLMDHRTLYSDLPAELRRYRDDHFDDKYKRLDWNDFSRSITAHIAKDGYWYIHPEQHRTLTVREAARTQTFPDDFRFAGTRSDAFRQIGNAVPPRLGEAAAMALLPTGDNSTAENRWLELHTSLKEWAVRQQQGRFWYLYPGEDVDQAVALVVAMVGPSRIESHQLGQALGLLRGLTKLRAKELARIHEAAGDNPRIAKRLAGIEDLTGLQRLWDDSHRLVERLALMPAERSLFLLLMGDDVILTSQGPLRVAARVGGKATHEKNRLTDGRVEIARLIGGGDDAPLRMAALRHLSTTHCLASADPFCGECPLQRWCRFAAEREDDQKLF